MDQNLTQQGEKKKDQKKRLFSNLSVNYISLQRHQVNVRVYEKEEERMAKSEKGVCWGRDRRERWW